MEAQDIYYSSSRAIATEVVEEVELMEEEALVDQIKL